jgi:hypothetical protein
MKCTDYLVNDSSHVSMAIVRAVMAKVYHRGAVLARTE